MIADLFRVFGTVRNMPLSPITLYANIDSEMPQNFIQSAQPAVELEVKRMVTDGFWTTLNADKTTWAAQTIELFYGEGATALNDFYNAATYDEGLEAYIAVNTMLKIYQNSSQVVYPPGVGRQEVAGFQHQNDGIMGVYNNMYNTFTHIRRNVLQNLSDAGFIRRWPTQEGNNFMIQATP